MTTVFTIKYRHGGVDYVLTSPCSEHLDVKFTTCQTKNGCGRFTLSIIPKNTGITLSEAKIDFAAPLPCDAFFANGYQSWTSSREYTAKERQKGIAPLRGFLAKKALALDKYGDYGFYKNYGKKGFFHSHTFSYLKDKNGVSAVGSLTEKQGFTILEYDFKRQNLSVKRDVEGLVLDGEFLALDVIKTPIFATLDEAFDAYFSLWNLPPAAKKLRGYTSWYNRFQDINEDMITKNIDAFTGKKIPLDIFQIDDGYQTAVGDWLSIDSAKFPNGLKPLADKIHACGAKAGLWLAPFVAETKSELFKNKPDWFLKDKKGQKICSGANWSRQYALDFYNAEVQNYLKTVFDTVLNCYGFDLVKLDFLYAAALFPPKNKTRGAVMFEAMEFLRKICGNKLILGCGVPLGSAFGSVDYCRIGCDATFNWNGKLLERGAMAERPCSRLSVQNAYARKMLNGRAFINDPDVFFIRKTDLKPNEKQALITAAKTCGGIALISDDVYNYSTQETKELTQIFESI